MKIKNIHLANYKGFKEPTTISFCDNDGYINDITLLIGNNGSGKTSILQAISAVLGSAARFDMKKPSNLEWDGFNYKGLCHVKEKDPEIQLEIEMTADELQATKNYSEDLAKFTRQRHDIHTHETNTQIKLDYIKDKVVSSNKYQSTAHLCGYEYALGLQKLDKGGYELFDRVGTILWYKEQRSASSSFSSSLPGNDKKSQIGISQLRDVLKEWYYFHIDKEKRGIIGDEATKDYYAIVENNYKKIFKGRSFYGAVSQIKAGDFFKNAEFYLQNEGLIYEISEMSAGERSIFPILVDFANWNINNSIIIIDEIELHLHAPLQQSLVRTLPYLGKNNQFIITTHSDNVASLFSPEQIKRAPLWQ